MITESQVLRIGRLGKAHGIKGEVNFRFDDDIFNQVDYPFLILKIDGIFVPFLIKGYRFKGEEIALVTFEDINSEQQASRLQGLEVYFPEEYFDEESDMEDADLSWNFLIGFTVYDTVHGKLGKVVNIDTQTMNALFLIKNEEEKELIIPATEDFIVSINTDNSTLNMQLPEGLLE